ncbi:hypothetical protein SAMN05428969_2467 [Devosia sp. YR412]|nr:hypothetical protein SAMN05428969_2467 [Devosia sp. YR412]
MITARIAAVATVITRKTVAAQTNMLLLRSHDR